MALEAQRRAVAAQRRADDAQERATEALREAVEAGVPVLRIVRATGIPRMTLLRRLGKVPTAARHKPIVGLAPLSAAEPTATHGR